MALATQFVQEGKTLAYTNSSGSDIAYLEVIAPTSFAHIIFIAAEAIANGKTGNVYTEGVFELPAITGTAFTFGEVLYFANGKLNKTSGRKVGFAAEAKASAAATALVKLIPGLSS